MRTVSKLGLAGARLGILIGRREWIAQIDKVRLPYNINVYTQAAATYLLAHVSAFREQTDRLIAERTVLAAELDKLFAYFPNASRYSSEANFILVRLPDAAQIFAALKARKILVKNTSQAHPLLHDTLRITIGSPAENAAFVAALTSILETQHA
jgi:histidinol-phosphate aminotransferase